MTYYILFDNTDCNFNCSGEQVTIIPLTEREGHIEQLDKCDACPQGDCTQDKKNMFIQEFNHRKVRLPGWFEGTWKEAARMNPDMISTKIKPRDLVFIFFPK